MTEQTKKPEAEIIVIPRARLAFARIHKAEQGKNKDGTPRGKAKFTATLLLDPTNEGQAASIKAVKLAAKKVVEAKWGTDQKQWPKANPATGMGGLIMCFGNGDDLPKVYDGYAGMFYVKLSDTSRPLLGNRAGGVVAEGDPEVPYSGCYVRARISPWVYFKSQKNPESANGVNFNFRSLQFVQDGAAFGGGGTRSADEEFDTAMAGDKDGGGNDEDMPF